MQPRIVVVMGERALETLNEVDVPLSRTLEADAGEDPGADPDDRRPLRPRHRRVARLRGVQARVLGGLPRARRLVRGPAAVLSRGAIYTAAGWSSRSGSIEELPERCENCGATLTDAEKQRILDEDAGAALCTTCAAEWTQCPR